MGQGPSTSQYFGESRVVKTKFGSIIGRRFTFHEREVDAFQGVPFAKPPVGKLRFEKPEWPQSWDGVKATKGFAARGIQKDPYFFEKMKLGKISEDNLYLNVFTPVWSPKTSSGFPVMVFVHGGGFVSDSSVKYGDVGICKHLCTKDVVVVTIQYRLGLLGFFSTGDEHCRGNFALWDQTLALRWVQENIAFFNGDPNNVTVMGQSAGGASVDLLSICPHSRGIGYRVLRKRNSSVDMDYSMIERLRALPASKFALSLIDNMKKSDVASRCSAGPRLDFDFIPKGVSELRKEAPAKPMLIGSSNSEGLMFWFGKDHSIGSIMDYISKVVPEKDHPNDFKKLREEIFRKLLSNPDDLVEETRAFVEIVGDIFVNVGVQSTILETLEAHHDAPVYFYSFDYYNPKSWGPLSLRWPFKDATHCTELAYIFAVGIIWNYDFTHDDKKMLEMTTTMWTNFAKYGNPNGIPEDPSSSLNLLCGEPFTWEPATLSNPQKHLSISLKPQMKVEYKKGRPLFIAQMRRQRSKSESNGI
ncbi:Carboxylic ester hydrolase [Trichostrongylus colubriformis]|uniref:Carboxylic ester hydrolase n=1 Tax=Trichostrongylus colubriformis TaxID=6319 RepID=A0AAN8FJV9_TRICO